MTEWWVSLSGPEQFFWSVALFSSILQVLLFASSLLGGGDFDHGGDVHVGAGGDAGTGLDSHEDVSHGVKFLSFRALVSFGVGFGWAGVLGLGGGWSLGWTLATALGFGIVFVAAIYFIMRLLVSLQDPGGGFNYWNAVGSEAHVYFTVPGARTGEGQVEVMLQGRLVTAGAVTEHPDPIPPRAPVIVLSVEGNNTLVVEPSTVRDHLISDGGARP